MEIISSILQIVQTLGGAGTVVVIFILWQAGYLKKQAGDAEVPEWAQTLTAHFNDETTKLLQDILEEQKRHNDIEDKVHQEIQDGFKDMRNKFGEYDKFGVKSYCKDDPK